MVRLFGFTQSRATWFTLSIATLLSQTVKEVALSLSVFTT
jgi:hypothetical protein